MVNLTKKTFSYYEFKLLNRNLNFIPNPGKYNTDKLEEDKNKFIRSVLLKSFFGDENNDDNDPYRSLRQSNNQWLPKKVHHSVETYIEKFNKDFADAQRVNANDRDNLSKEERRALGSLRNRDDIIITHADKGGAVVIISVEDYIKEAERQLKDVDFYAELSHNPTNDHAEVINKTIKGFIKEKLITEKLGKNLIQEDPKTPNLYFRPKIHKTNNPGRPIVSSINSHSSKISEFVDIHLKDIVDNIKSHIKDTTDFIKKIEMLKDLPQDAILVTMDVKSLFTQIPHSEGINAVARALEKLQDSKISNRVIIKFLSLTLHLNNFEFNGKHYLQKKGSSMGSKRSCRYADVFMDDFETRFIYPRIHNKNMAYYRFVDDIFMIWTGTEAELLSFFKEINTVHDSIKFDCNYSKENVNFLDTTVFKNERRTLSTKLYTKPTDRPGYIHSKSYHPNSQIKNIPYGQALRAKRISTEKHDLKLALENIKKNFISRGYKPQNVDDQFLRINDVNRKELLEYKEKKNEKKLKFITTFNRNLPKLREAIGKNWDILLTNEKQAELFKEKPIIAFKRNRNLKDMLGGSKLLNNKKVVKGSRKEGQCRPCLSQVGNKCCKHLLSTKTFRSSTTGERFTIRHQVNCGTKKGIYLGSCELCPKPQYVGKFETFWNKRLYNHRKDAKKVKSIPFDEHFQLPGHDFTKHAKFIIIEALENHVNTAMDRKVLEEREDHWVARLQTMKPNGFNDKWNSPTRTKIQRICT